MMGEHILLVESRDRLLSSHEEAITRWGFQVTRVSPQRACAMLGDHADFGAVVLGPYLNPEQRQTLAVVAKPQAKVVMLYAGSLRGTELADGVISAHEPEALVMALQDLTGNIRGIPR